MNYAESAHIQKLRANKKLVRGFTLVEALIYIVLFSVVIGGGVASSFYLIQSSAETRGDVMSDAEANFVLRKVDYLLTSAQTVSQPGSGPSLVIDGVTVGPSGSPPDNISVDGVELISDSAKLADFALNYDGLSDPKEVTMRIEIRNVYEPDDPGKLYETIHYLRP